MKERLKVEHLSVSFFTDEGEVQAVRDVSFSLNAGEVLAVVGESGCGKSVLCKSIMKLLRRMQRSKTEKFWSMEKKLQDTGSEECGNCGENCSRWFSRIR